MKLFCKIGWGVSLVLALALGFMSYTFLIRGKVEIYEDGRTAILLQPNERNKVLGEMRGLLEAVQMITVAASDNDMDTVIAAATAVGMGAARAENPQLIAKLPLDFKIKGMATHQAFDDLAAVASDGWDGAAVLRQLGVVMENCTSCHGGYRLGIDGVDSGA